MALTTVGLGCRREPNLQTIWLGVDGFIWIAPEECDILDFDFVRVAALSSATDQVTIDTETVLWETERLENVSIEGTRVVDLGSLIKLGAVDEHTKLIVTSPLGSSWGEVSTFQAHAGEYLEGGDFRRVADRAARLSQE